MLEEEAAAAALDTDNLDELIKAAAAFGWAKKARDIVGIDLHEVSSVADYFLIMSGSNKPQLKAISDNIEEKLAEQGLHPLRIEGLMSYVRNLEDGPHYYKWQREYLYSEEDRRVMLVMNMENHLRDEEIFELMKERFEA